MDLQTILAVLGGIATLFGLVKGLYKFWQVGIYRFWQWIHRRLAFRTGGIPRRTVAIIPLLDHTRWWHMGAMGDKPVMQIVADFYVTNITDDPVSITTSRLIAYGWKWRVVPVKRAVDGNALVQHPEGSVYGHYELVPKIATDARADWFLKPPILAAGAPLRARFCLVDQYGNEHWTRMLTWRYT